MNLIHLVLTLTSINIVFVLFIIYLSVQTKNLSISLVAIPLLFSVTAWSGMLLQSTFGISDIADRQILANILITFWALKFSAYNRNLKIQILRYLLNENFHIHGLGFFEKTKTLLRFMGCFMIILMPMVSLNFLSGNSDLGILDTLAALIFVLGIVYEMKALSELKKLLLNNDEKVHSEGLWFFSRHPDLFGQLISWWGLYLFALGAYGGEWSIFGPLLATYLYLKKFLVDMEVNLTRKYNGYNEYKSLTPGILPKVSFLKS
jgi:steroid 5-alpha reductase family enzyme